MFSLQCNESVNSQDSVKCTLVCSSKFKRMFAAALTASSDKVDSACDVRSQGEMIFDPMRMFSQASHL